MNSLIKPHKHQKDCIKAIHRVRESGREKALFVMASGMGKTHTSAFEYQKYQNKHPESRLLFLAHRNEILEQAHGIFQRIFGPSMKLGTFNGYARDIHGANAVFASFQSIKKELFKRGRRAKQKYFVPNRFDYIIVDESHHGQARTYKKVIDYFEPDFLLGMTATPDRMDLKDIRKIFGPEVYSKNLTEAMREGLLCPIEYHVMADEIVDKGMLKIPPHKISLHKLNRIFFARKRDVEIRETILKKIQKVAFPRVIIFCPSIRHAESFSQIMPSSLSIHSSLPLPEYRRRMNLIRNGFVRVAVTVDKFNEGVDIPEANVIVFLRSTQSRTVLLQQLGRGLRKVEDKDRVLVLDFVASCDRLRFLRQFSQGLKTKGPIGQRRSFHVNFGSVIFDDRARNILHILERVEKGLTPEVLIDYLKKLAKKLGRTPTIIDMDKADGFPSAWVYKINFGSWSKALKAAGMEPVPRSYSKNFLIQKLIELKKKLRKVPMAVDMDKADGFPSASVYYRCFGSWVKALKAAGMEPVPRSYSKNFLIQKLIELKKKLRKVPSKIDMDKADGFPSAWVYKINFGSWVKALKAAGMEPTHIYQSYSKNQLIQKLKELKKKLGRTPSTTDMDKADGFPCSTTYRKRFGSWNKALKAAGIKPKQIKRKRDKR